MNTLQFDNQFSLRLPADTRTTKQPRAVYGAMYSHVRPEPAPNPTLLAYSKGLAEEMGLDIDFINSQQFLDLVSGRACLAEMNPIASCYGGHQFGHWAGQLGDGRAISLAEMIHKSKRYEWQLKGGGLTPYSRGADGKAVLRSSMREFLASEAMHYLGVPTTRALSLVTTGERVIRDMFYDGRPEAELGAMVLRIAPSFIRFGHFELPAKRGDLQLLKQLVNFTLERDFPDISGSDEQRFSDWFITVCQTTATLIVQWTRVGFVHGVMNTDNMSILGLTIDYGPYGYLDSFDPMFTPNTTDGQRRRYCFAAQAAIARWNLQCLAQALAGVAPNSDCLEQGLNEYDRVYAQGMVAMLSQKLGLENWQADDAIRVERLYQLLHQSSVDMTLFYSIISDAPLSQLDYSDLKPAFYDMALFEQHRMDWLQWLNDYKKRGSQASDEKARALRMQKANPRFIVRNYLVQQAIEAADQGDFNLLHQLQERIQTPYNIHPEDHKWCAKRPDWALNKPGCSMLSCSS